MQFNINYGEKINAQINKKDEEKLPKEEKEKEPSSKSGNKIKKLYGNLFG